jgi:outer membrane immunogenic protein
LSGATSSSAGIPVRIITATTLASIALGGVAAAADMAVPPVPVALPAPWQGFYLGVNAGGTFGDANNDFGFASVDLPLKGAMGGGQIGYNWQAGPMVYGLETDFQGSSLKGSISTPCLAPLCGLPLSASYSQELRWFGTVRGRVGYAQAGWVLYATGGYAYGHVDTNATATAGPVSAQLSTSETANGWTAGAGAEMLLAPRWSVKIEYLYVDLGHVTTSFPIAGLPTINDSTHVNFNVVRAGANFRF